MFQKARTYNLIPLESQALARPPSQAAAGQRLPYGPKKLLGRGAPPVSNRRGGVGVRSLAYQKNFWWRRRPPRVSPATRSTHSPLRQVEP